MRQAACRMLVLVACSSFCAGRALCDEKVCDEKVSDEKVSDEKQDKPFRPLFNGRDLDGWYTFLQKHGRDSDPDRIITIEDGVIHLYKHSENGARVVQGYIGTNEEYANYHFRAEYKWGEKKFEPRLKLLQDGGIYYHMTGRDNVWPRALQFQIERNNVGDIVTVGNIRYDTTIDPATGGNKKPAYLAKDGGGVPHTHGQAYISHLSRAGMHEHNGWNVLEIIARGDSAEHRLNSLVVARLTGARRPNGNADKFIPLARGRILLEIEAAELYYRNIEIKQLAPSD